MQNRNPLLSWFQRVLNRTYEGLKFDYQPRLLPVPTIVLNRTYEGLKFWCHYLPFSLH